MKYLFITLLSFFTIEVCIANDRGSYYTSYFTGSPKDVTTQALGGVCLMGGATENDNAMKWFLQRANGGDILVLRASGADGYNNYLYSELGVPVNSVETIVFNVAAAANETYIHDKISKAEAIWFAGGDQWKYVSYWRNTKIDSLINDGIKNRNIVIGGTSAGMAILGGFYFTAENGTITSATALNNPYGVNVTIDSATFIKTPFLKQVITDTHYDNPDRRGRHITFMARIMKDYGIIPLGIACEEYTAVCIDENGIAKVYGEYPSYEDYAYFIRPNCEIGFNEPETCSSGTPLTWNYNGQALKVYKVAGTANGDNTFNLLNWQSGNGGNWEVWSVNAGTFNSTTSSAISCALNVHAIQTVSSMNIYPNPANEFIVIENDNSQMQQIRISDVSGRVLIDKSVMQERQTTIDVSNLQCGYYIIEIHTEKGISIAKLMKE